MSQPSPTPVPVRDRVKLPIEFDAARLQAEVQALAFNHFIYYDVMQLRAPAHMVDPSLPPPPPADDYADGSWTEWMDTASLKASPYLSQVIDTFRAHTRVTLVRLLRLEGQSEVKEHTDPTLGLHIEKSVIRLTVPIFSGEAVSFYLNDSVVPMQPGECWYLRLTDPHRVINAGPDQRINLTIDMVPNAWVRELIGEDGTEISN